MHYRTPLVITNIAIILQVIPINRQHQLLERVRGRLSDRSSSVRKSAIVLLTSFLTSNPYAARVSCDC